jgi:hypothetical protein
MHYVGFEGINEHESPLDSDKGLPCNLGGIFGGLCYIRRNSLSPVQRTQLKEGDQRQSGSEQAKPEGKERYGIGKYRVPKELGILTFGGFLAVIFGGLLLFWHSW